ASCHGSTGQRNNEATEVAYLTEDSRYLARSDALLVGRLYIGRGHGEPEHEVQYLSFVRRRYLCGSCEEKAVRTILDESGALSALQTTDDVSHHSKVRPIHS